MNNQKIERKPADQEDGDHTQPINLVAARAQAPATSATVTFSGMTVPVPTQAVSSRSHADAAKTGGLMTLYFRTPAATRPPGPGHIMAPVMGTQVASAQHFSTKHALKSLKGVRVGYYQEKTSDKAGASGNNEFNIKVIRMPAGDVVQSQGGSTPQTVSPAMSPGILPNALTGNTSRHIVPAAVHPVIPAGSALPGPMASIIKGGHQVSQVGHVIHHQHYSSHVPRGPAAVASISAGPKSAVATPILRAPHSSGTMTLSSSMISPHAPVRARSPTLIGGRTSTPPVAPSACHAQVIDLQKNSLGHPLCSNQSQMGITSRSVDIAASSVRTGITHPSSITIAKPISISQPIVQHLQQVSEKGYLKTISGITSVTTTPSNSTLAHQNMSVLSGSHSTSNEVQSVCVMPTVTRATISNIAASGAYTTGIVQLPASAAIPQHVPTLRPSLVQPQTLHSLTSSINMTSAQVTSHQTFAVISAKSLPPCNPSVTLATSLNRTSIATPITSTGSITKPGSSLPTTTARLPSASNTSCQASIPIAKVYPQPLPTVTQVSGERVGTENMRATPVLTQAASVSSVSIAKTSACVTTVAASTVTTTTAAATSVPPQVVLPEKRNDSTTASVRFTSITKQPVASGASFAVPSAAYLYDQYQGSLSVHPYSVASSNQGFSTALPATQLRPLALSQHGTSNISSTPHACVPVSSSAPVQPLNSLMVAVDSRHVALPYNRVAIGGGKAIAELVPHTSTTCSSQSVNAAANLVALSQASASHNSVQGQGNVSNHLSPRPSILRKRATEPVTGVAKRNLLTSLCAPELASPSSEFASSMNLSTESSPKPSNGHVRENGMMTPAAESDNIQGLVQGFTPFIKKEPGISDNKTVCLGNDDFTKDTRPLETSPRKKPRKQLLAANELIETHSSDGDENFERDVKDVRETRTEDDNVRWVTFCKRPTMSLLSNYRHGWKSRHNHFLRYSDVKPKEEKPPSVSEFANQKGIIEEVNGWKVYHITGQMEDLSACEESSYSRLSCWLDLEEKSSLNLAGKSPNPEDAKILNKLTDLVKGNLQRSKICQEQSAESQQQILKMIDHKPNVVDIVNKYVSRRTLKKKEKT